MNNTTIDNNLLRQLMFIAIIIFLGIVLFRELWFFVPAVLGAVTFYMLMRERMFYLVEKKNWKPSRAAWVLMLLSFFVILVPLGLLGNIIVGKVGYVVNHSGEIAARLQAIVNQIQQKTGYKIITPDAVNKAGSLIAGLVPKVLGTTFNTLTLIFSLYFILYFMLVNARAMEASVYQYIPLKDGNVELIGKEVKNMVLSNAIAIPLIALIQGLVGLAGYLIIGVNEPWVWFVATCVAAMLPVVGAAIIYVPLSLMLLAQGQTGKGIAMALWGLILIGLSDNVFRLMINRKMGNIHPLITIFGVIVGIQLFGFIGLIFGPLLISMFLLLVKIYGSEFIVKKRELGNISGLTEK